MRASAGGSTSGSPTSRAGGAAHAKGMIDFSEPVAVLLFAILHFLTDADDPHRIVDSPIEALAPGSAVAIWPRP